jgi:ribosomal protein S18 acetylase RimI-like enzyme
MRNAKTLSTSIDRPARDVYDFVSNPENLPRWASGASANLRRDGARWLIDMPDGPVEIRFVDRNEFGVLDHFVTTPDGRVYFNPMRVVDNGAGSEVVFTVFQFAGVSDEQFLEDVATVARDLQALKRLLEAHRMRTGPVTLRDCDIVLASLEDALEILPMMEAFNGVEGIAWRPAVMGKALRRLLAEPGLGLVTLARERSSSTVVGYGLATFGYDLEFAGADAYITELFVKPEFRSRGFGQALLDSTTESLRRRGAHAVHLMVRPDNERARALYESRGFRVAPRIMMTKELGGEGD